MITRQSAIMTTTSPFAGHRQVDSFGPDEEYLSEEEEVVYATLDLGTVEPTLLSSSSTYRLVVSTRPCLSWHHYKSNQRAWIPLRHFCNFLARFLGVGMMRSLVRSFCSQKAKVSDHALYQSLLTHLLLSKKMILIGLRDL